MITDQFVYNIHKMFNELGYKTDVLPDFSKFQKKAIDTLNKCKTTSDAGICLTYFNYCTKHWDKIEKIFQKNSKLELWKYLKFGKPNEIETYKYEEEALGSYFITNAFDKNYKQIYLTSLTFDNVLYDLGKIGKDFEIGDYKLKFSFLSSTKVKIINNFGNVVCIVNFDTKYTTITLKDNYTKYDLVYRDNVIGIIDKYDKLSNNIADDKIIADISWDIINAKSDLGICIVDLYKEIPNEDFDLILAIATTTFTLFAQYMSAVRATTTTSSLIAINSMNRLLK